MIPQLSIWLPILTLLCCLARSHSEPATQPTPFTVWIDLSRRDSRPVSWPIWLESIEKHDHLSTDQRGMIHTVRLRFRRFSHLGADLLVRLHFVDDPGTPPSLTAWSETGSVSIQSGPLGQRTGLPTFETVVLPMENVDYLDIDVPGSGRSLIGMVLTSLDPAAIAAPVDFMPRETAIDPFGASAPDFAGGEDTELFGRLKATLLHEVLLLSAGRGQWAALEFDLESPPLLALVTFEVLNLDPRSPLHVRMNGVPLGTAEAHLPDLADPAWRGTVRPLQRDMEFHYAGWTRCRKIVPASALVSGLNRLEIQSGTESETVAVRAVELQLKYNSSSFDYNLAPLAR